MTTPQKPATASAPLFEPELDVEITAKMERTLILGLSPTGAPTDMIRPAAGSAPARSPNPPPAMRAPAKVAPRGPAPGQQPARVYLSPEIVKVAESFPEPEAIAGLVRVMMRTVERINLELVQWFELACTHLLMLGYSPDECVIEHRDRPTNTRHVLKVRGLEVFVVTVSRHFDGDNVETVVTPILIGWPSAKPSR